NRNCLSYGPGNLELAHKPDEYVDLADIARCYQVLLKLAEQNLTA
ncbi:MAG: M20/M25/M40 family metallo-hydrolase, partial [Bacillota bacterium]|nr:M20/M25/M40 family metallo-hydrolase [Bacillota bacterium]